MEGYISIGKAARFLGVTVATLRRWDKAGELKPGIRTAGGHRRYSGEQLLQFLRSKSDEGRQKR